MSFHSEGQHYPGKAVWIFCETGANSSHGFVKVAVWWVAKLGLWDVVVNLANLLHNMNHIVILYVYTNIRIHIRTFKNIVRTNSAGWKPWHLWFSTDTRGLPLLNLIAFFQHFGHQVLSIYWFLTTLMFSFFVLASLGETSLTTWQRPLMKICSVAYLCFQTLGTKSMNLPSRELTYPPKMAFWRWFSFSQGGIC